MVFPVPGGFVVLNIVTHSLSLDFVPISFLWRALWESAIVLGSGSYPRSKPIMPQESEDENRHAATDPECCEKMQSKYGFGELLAVEKTGHPILKVECVFEGPQTTFAEEDGSDDD